MKEVLSLEEYSKKLLTVCFYDSYLKNGMEDDIEGIIESIQKDLLITEKDKITRDQIFYHILVIRIISIDFFIFIEFDSKRVRKKIRKAFDLQMRAHFGIIGKFELYTLLQDGITIYQEALQGCNFEWAGTRVGGTLAQQLFNPQSLNLRFDGTELFYSVLGKTKKVMDGYRLDEKEF